MTPVPSERAWRVLSDDGSREPRRNLALDEALGRTAGPTPTLRLWRNDRCVVVGRFQVAAAEVDDVACRELDVPVYRRFTGGGAVYHDRGNLNVTIAVRRTDPLVSRRPERALLPGLYGLLLEPLAATARSLGVPAVATERDLLVGDRKMGGVAAWIGGEAILVHGTLLVDADLATLERVLNGPGAPGDARWERTRSRRSPVTSLARERAVGSDTDPGRVDAAVDAAVVAAVTEGAATATLTAEELALTARLAAGRYDHPGWHAQGTS